MAGGEVDNYCGSSATRDLLPPPLTLHNHFPSININFEVKSNTMFYTGDLQSGISKAVQESKFVAALVTGIYVASSGTKSR